MTTNNTMKKILLALCAVLAVMMAAPTPASAKTKTDTAANDNDTAAVFSAITISEELKIEDVTDASSLEKIGAAYDAETNTLRFQSDLSLEQRLIISPKQTLIIDLNGHTVTGSIFEIQNRKKAPVTLTGTGTFQQCEVDKYGDGKLTLEGDIEYYAGDSIAFFAGQGESVIKSGNFYAAENHCAVSADYDYELGDSYLYIKGGNINGPLNLSNIRTTIYGGNINGRIANCCGLYIKGGVIQKGIVTYVGSEDATGSITISGGKVLDQILIDDHWGSRLTITGGVIKSDKEAVIEARIPNYDEYSHADITVTGGKIISTCENGYGIRAVNSEISFKGGTITNTTKKGNIGIYSERYNDNRKNVKTSKAAKASIKGFSTTIKNKYFKDYCGENVFFKLDKDGTLTIYGTGELEPAVHFYSMNIKKVIVEEGITSVNGFECCEKLESVVLPSSVKEIKYGAFSECRALKEVTLSSGLEVIGNSAFWCDFALEKINIPDSVTTIGQYAFKDCRKLKNIHLPDNLTTLSDSSFAYCKSLKSVEIPEGVTHIYYGTFYSCTKLERVKLPSTLEYIDAVAFISCVKLKELELPANLKEIGRSAFKNCRRIKTIELPSSIVEIDKLAFKNCESLETVIMDNVSKDAKISKSAFDNTPYKRNMQK